ncbi:hypothetical protein AB0B88_16060 [Micromonospora haikouensis]|uniref:hypothetical protein n=1 Tax=Micromonospora haikouensis TaxID=686309 RepID=UPI00340AE2F8
MPTPTTGTDLAPYRPPAGEPPEATRPRRVCPARGMFAVAGVGLTIAVVNAAALAVTVPAGTARTALVLLTAAGGSLFGGGLLFGVASLPTAGGPDRG